MRKQIFFIIISLIVLISIFVSYYFIQCSRYKRNFEEMEYCRINALYSQFYEVYYTQHSEFPLSDSIITVALNSDYPDEYEKIRMRHFVDFLSPHKNNLIYFPIYDNYKRRTSYILLSVGIDGKQNNFLSETDTLYFTDWWKKLKTYNYQEVLNEGRVISNRKPDFNILDCLFGKKDFVIQIGTPVEHRLLSTPSYKDGL